jgi:hypothetical protein
MSDESGMAAIPWRIQSLEREMASLRQEMGTKVSKEAFRERRLEIDQHIAQVAKELEELEKRTGVELTALRESLTTLSRGWEEEKLNKVTTDLQLETTKTRTAMEFRREKFWRTMTLIVAVAALLWSVLKPIWFP